MKCKRPQSSRIVTLIHAQSAIVSLLTSPVWLIPKSLLTYYVHFLLLFCFYMVLLALRPMSSLVECKTNSSSWAKGNRTKWHKFHCPRFGLELFVSMTSKIYRFEPLWTDLPLFLSDGSPIFATRHPRHPLLSTFTTYHYVTAWFCWQTSPRMNVDFEPSTFSK